MAKRDEDVGADFYEALAEKTGDEKLRKRFLEIREQELMHSKRSYMETDDAVGLARNVTDDVEGIKLALSQEKNTLLFFMEMKEHIPSNHHKEFVQIVIDEERGHIAELSEVLMERME